MKTLITTTPLVNLKGEEMKDGDTLATIGAVIANILCGVGIENPARAYQLAKKLSTEDSVELKAEDVVYLVKQMNGNKQMSAMVIGQIIEELES